MIRTTPFHPRLSELNTQGLYTHWQGHLSALRYTHAPKHEYFAVRNAVGVFDTSPLFKYRIHGPDAEQFLAGVLVRDIRTCRPGQRAVHPVVRRPRVRDGGRRRLPALRDRLPADRGAAQPRLVQRPPWPAAGRARGRLRGLRHPRRPGPAVADRAVRAGARGRLAAVLRADRHQDRLRAGHAVAHRLHRRPGLRDHRRGRPRLDVLDAILEAGAGPRHPAVRRGGADDAAHRGGAAAHRRGVAQQPAPPSPTTSGSPPPSSAWAGCSAAWPTTTARSSVAPRSGASWPRSRRGGPASASSSTGGTGTRCTATPACCRPRTSSRCPTSRCCTTGRRPAGGPPGRLRHQLHVLPRPAAPHRPGPRAARPGGARLRGAHGAGRQPLQHHRAGPHGASCPCSTPRERRPKP